MRKSLIVAQQCIAMSMSVCLSTLISLKPHVQTSPNFLHMLPMAVVLRYALYITMSPRSHQHHALCECMNCNLTG